MADRKETYPPNPHAYQIDEEPFIGYFSRVYRAKCTKNENCEVACRLLDLKKHARIRAEAFELGARVMSKLDHDHDHPNILSPHTSFTDSDLCLWTVMPFFPSGSLRTIMLKYYPGGFPEDYIAVILQEILNALNFLHQRGLRHTGVKASNIFFGHGHVKLSDLGTSSSFYKADQVNEVTEGIINSWYWRAPEARHDKEFTIKNDIWAFGMTALELAHGRPPLSFEIPCKTRFAPARFRFSDYLNNYPDHHLSESFVQMLRSCLDPLPDKRPPAAELLQEYDFFSNPNLPTLGEVISGINQVIMATGGEPYPISPTVVEEKSQSTVDSGTSQAENEDSHQISSEQTGDEQTFKCTWCLPFSHCFHFGAA